MHEKKKIVTYEMIKRCPNKILLLDHYNWDGTCRCNDRDHTIMERAGYRWDTKIQRWV